MYVLGINAFHPDSSAVLLGPGGLIAAAEEERFVGVKHSVGFPAQSVRFCLERALISPEDLDYVAVARMSPWASVLRFMGRNTFKPSVFLMNKRLEHRMQSWNCLGLLSRYLNVDHQRLRARIIFVEHHRAHLASAFFASGFDSSALLSVDSSGDGVSCALGIGAGNKIRILKRIFAPDSLGFFYTAATQFLGFPNFGDEYKVMALASFGTPLYAKEIKSIIKFDNKNGFMLNRKFFNLDFSGFDIGLNEGGRVAVPFLFNQHWSELLCPARGEHDPILQIHMDVAATVQCVLEEAYVSLLKRLYAKTKKTALCLAGGVAFNCLANARAIPDDFENVFIQPASGDAGTSLGAALDVYHTKNSDAKPMVMRHSYWGNEYSVAEIETSLSRHGLSFDSLHSSVLAQCIASYIAQGCIVAWFQGRMEWGPRALGNRSILADPRKIEIKHKINSRIKKREDFRPFAPVVLDAYVPMFTDVRYPFTFMQFAVNIKPQAQELIKAAIHYDGTARLQSVSREDNPLLYALIEEFRILTGVPALLNTSFNISGPIVASPDDAIECFLKSPIDVLVIGGCVSTKATVDVKHTHHENSLHRPLLLS